MALGDVIARLSVVLGMETAAFEKGTTLAQKEAAKLHRKMQDLGDRMSSVGKVMSVGITAPLTAFGYSAFNAAADAEELQAAFDYTFGEMSDEMNKWARETGDAMGRSTQAMQRGAFALGGLFKGAVETEKEAAELSRTFTELSQDLGAFFNIAEDDALNALRSGLSGEAEPLRRFNVYINDAAVKTKALEMGLVPLNGKLTDQQKILARSALILEQTADAQGAVAREQGSATNQVRVAQAAWEELQVTIGTKLLPTLTPLIATLGRVFEWFSKLPSPVQNVIVVVGALATAVGPVLIAVGNLLPLLVKLGPVLGVVKVALLGIAANPVILGLAAVIGGIYLAWQNWDKIEPILRRLYEGVKAWVGDKLSKVLFAVLNPIKAVKNAFFDLYDAVVGNSYIPDMVVGIGHWIGKLGAEMVRPAEQFAMQTEQTFDNMANGVLNTISRLASSVKSGGFMDILGSVIGLGVQLGGLGAFGSKIAANINKPTGVPSMVPQPSIRAMPPVNDNPPMNIQVEASPYFDVRVNGQIAQRAPSIAGAGANLAQQQMAMNQKWRLA